MVTRIPRHWRARIGLVSLLLAAFVAAAPAPAPATHPCDPTAPELRGVTITQGVSSYTRMSAAKTALFRALIQVPSCTTASMTLTGAFLTPTVDGAPKPEIPAWSPLSPTAIDAFSATVSSGSPGHPLFVVPGGQLTSLGPVASFQATFSLRLTYQVKSGGTTTPGTRTYTQMPHNTGPIAATFDNLNRLPLLILPMGNEAAPGGAAGQYTSDDRAAVQDAIVNVARALPTRDGAVDLCRPEITATCVATDHGGVRWHTNPDMMDTGAGTATDPGVNALVNGRFCGSGLFGNFPRVAVRGLSYHAAWNLANPAAQVAFVLGVPGQDASWGFGSPEPGGAVCDEGRAMRGLPFAWVRALRDKPTAKPPFRSPTAGYALMEFGHFLNLVPDQRDDPGDKAHSLDRSADLGAGDAYNVLTRKLLSDDHSAMKLDLPAYTNDNVLYQAFDYAFAQCMFGGQPSATPGECTTPGTIGSAAASTDVYEMVGQTDGTMAGTAVDRAGRISGQPRGADPNSLYRFVIRGEADLILKNEGVVVGEESPSHVGDPVSGTGVFSFALPDEAGGKKYQLHKVMLAAQPPDASTLLASFTDTAAPHIDSIEVTPAEESLGKQTDTSGTSEQQPTISPDGTLYAYTAVPVGSACGSVFIAPTPGHGSIGPVAVPGPPSGPDCPSFPSIRADNGAIAVTDQGDLWTIRMEVTSDAEGQVTGITFSDPVAIYTCVAPCVSQPTQIISGAVRRSAWERDPTRPEAEQRLAFEIAGATGSGDVGVVRAYDPDVQVGGISAFNTTLVAADQLVFEGEPSWSPPGPGTRILFRRGAADIHQVAPDGDPATLQRLFCCGTLPSQGGPRHVAVENAGSIYIADLEDPGNPENAFTPVPTRKTSGFPDTYPALHLSPADDFEGFMLFDRTFDAAGAGEQHDLMIMRFGGKQVIRVKGSDEDNVADTFVDIFVDFGNTLSPVAVSLPPAVSGTTATFETVFDPEFLAPGAVAGVTAQETAARMCDTVDCTGVVGGPPVGTGADKPPVADIVAPSFGERVSACGNLRLVGTGDDPEQGKLTTGTWSLKGPGDPDFIPLPQTASELDLPPPPGCRPSGTWQIRWAVADSAGQTDDDTTAVLVTRDVVADFDPNTYFVPNKGNWFTFRIASPEAKEVDGGTVQIVEVGGLPYSQKAFRWGCPSACEAKFETGPFDAFLGAHPQLIGRYLPVVVTACSKAGCADPGFILAALDPAAPVAQTS